MTSSSRDSTAASSDLSDTSPKPGSFWTFWTGAASSSLAMRWSSFSSFSSAFSMCCSSRCSDGSSSLKDAHRCGLLLWSPLAFQLPGRCGTAAGLEFSSIDSPTA